MTARSVSGSSPVNCAGYSRPSGKFTVIEFAECTTWLLVRMNPSGVIMKPEPLPLSSRVPRGRFMRCFTSMFTTAGPTRARSEEHTSELQSRRDLVSRLLLEKKKKKIITYQFIKKKKKNKRHLTETSKH